MQPVGSVRSVNSSCSAEGPPVLAATAGPYLGDYVTNSRLREAGNLLLTETLMAQSEAIKRNTTIRLSTDGQAVQVLDMTVPGAPVVLRERTLPAPVAAPAATLDFAGEGRPTPDAQRPLEGDECRLRVVLQRAPPLRSKRPELVRIDRIRGDAQDVPGRVGDEHAVRRENTA